MIPVVLSHPSVWDTHPGSISSRHNANKTKHSTQTKGEDEKCLCYNLNTDKCLFEQFKVVSGSSIVFVTYNLIRKNHTEIQAVQK